jgi:hypothetical protein
MQPTASNSLPLQTLSDNGKPPSRRVNDADDAREIVAALVYANRERAFFNTKIKGMLDGNPPYNAAKLKQNAQAYRTNVNFMEGEASLSAAMVPFYDLFAGSRNYCEVKLYLDNPDDQEYKSGIVTEEFDCLLKKYKAFDVNMNGMLHDRTGFGKGFIMFPKQWGWHFQRVSFNRVFVPDSAEASVETVELVAIRENMQLHTLWNYVKDRETARSAGWKTDECAEAIRQAMPDDKDFQGIENGSSYPYVQQRMRDKDILNGTRQPTVQIVHLLVKEFDGTITHMMIEETTPATRGGSNNKDGRSTKFLFDKQKKFDNMREVLSAFFFETLDGSWNGARGLGHKIYSSIEIKNRLLNKTVDNAFLTGGIVLQARDASSKQKTALVQVGDATLIPEGWEVLNAQIFANSSNLVGTNALLDQTISSNTGIYRAKIDKPQGNPRTAKEVEVQFQNATTLSNSAVSRLYNELDSFYSELYRRVTSENPIDSDKSEEAEAVREFRKRCKKRGVEAADLKKVESVRACRNIGNGSQFQRQQSLERFEPFVPLLPESGKQHWMELLVASEFGQGMVNYLVPPRDKQLQPNDQQAMAMLENSAMKSGAPVAWTPTQNNVIHATEHLKAMSGGADSLQQGADPVTVLGFMETVGPHVMQHLDKLANDPSRKTEFALLSKEFQKVSGFADTLSAHIQDQQEANQQQQQESAAAQAQAQAITDGSDPETMIAKAKAQSDMSIKSAKAAQAIQLKEQSARQKLAVTDLKTAQALRINVAKAKTSPANRK